MLIKSKPSLFNVFLPFLSWTALILELYIILKADIDANLGFTAGIDRYFSYFTIVTNLFVAVVFTAQLYKNKQNKFWHFFARNNVISCATAAIIVVCIVYHYLLSSTHKLQGFNYIVDRTLHYVIPPLTIIFWWLVVPKNKINFIGVLSWLVYPLAYFMYILIRGALTHMYPYDFINVDKNGFLATLQFAGGLFAFYIFLGFILVGINKFIKRVR